MRPKTGRDAQSNQGRIGAHVFLCHVSADLTVSMFLSHIEVDDQDSLWWIQGPRYPRPQNPSMQVDPPGEAHLKWQNTQHNEWHFPQNNFDDNRERCFVLRQKDELGLERVHKGLCGPHPGTDKNLATLKPARESLSCHFGGSFRLTLKPGDRVFDFFRSDLK